MTAELDYVEIHPTREHRYSLIWMHGLGADGHDFEGIVPALKLPKNHGIHFVFPNAPVQAVTINGGMKMPSWYDILEMSLERKVDIDGIYQSAATIVRFIEKEIAAGIPAENIALAGFSQGGVIALHTGLRFPQKLAGILALSTYLPTVEQLKTEKAPANQSTPILMVHGTHDPVVSLQTAQQAFDALKKQKYPIEWLTYPMEHAVCPEEIQRIAAFISTVFKTT